MLPRDIQKLIVSFAPERRFRAVCRAWRDYVEEYIPLKTADLIAYRDFHLHKNIQLNGIHLVDKWIFTEKGIYDWDRRKVVSGKIEHVALCGSRLVFAKRHDNLFHIYQMEDRPVFLYSEERRDEYKLILHNAGLCVVIEFYSNTIDLNSTVVVFDLEKRKVVKRLEFSCYDNVSIAGRYLFKDDDAVDILTGKPTLFSEIMSFDGNFGYKKPLLFHRPTGAHIEIAIEEVTLHSYGENRCLVISHKYLHIIEVRRGKIIILDEAKCSVFSQSAYLLGRVSFTTRDKLINYESGKIISEERYYRFPTAVNFKERKILFIHYLSDFAFINKF